MGNIPLKRYVGISYVNITVAVITVIIIIIIIIIIKFPKSTLKQRKVNYEISTNTQYTNT